MLLLLALLAAAGLLASGERVRPAGGELPIGELVDALLEGELSAAERRELADKLVAAGYPEQGARLRGETPAAEPTAPSRREQALAVLAVVRDWRSLGGDEQACLALEADLVKAVQRAFDLAETGRWDTATAVLAQGVISEAPASCDLADFAAEIEQTANLPAEPADWVRP